MREYLPIFIVLGIIGIFTLGFIAAYVREKHRKDGKGQDRNIPDGEIMRRLMVYAKPYWKEFLLVFFLAYIFCCAVSICAVVWVLLSEMYPTRVRGLAMSIAGLALWVGTYLIGQLTPWMLENLTPAGTFFLFAAMCVPYMLIIWRAVPETTGRSLEEIEKYWQKNE